MSCGQNNVTKKFSFIRESHNIPPLTHRQTLSEKYVIQVISKRATFMRGLPIVKRAFVLSPCPLSIIHIAQTKRKKALYEEAVMKQQDNPK